MVTSPVEGGLYLYCVIPKIDLQNNQIKGMDMSKVYAIEHKDIMAVVSDSEYKVLDMSTENFMLHEEVVGKFMKLCDVVPFNFGNVLKSKADLVLLLDKTYPYIIKTLRKIEGKVELGLKVFIKKEYLSSEIENNEIIALKKRVEQTPVEAQNMLKIDLGKLVKNALDVKQEEIRQKLFEQLKQVSFDAKINECSMVNMVLNSAFLVDKEKLEFFTEKLNELSPPFDEKYIFKFTGPWPAYNFVEMPEG